MTKESFTIPDNFDFQAISASHFGVHWSDEETLVRIRFSSKVAPYIKERTWHLSQAITDNSDGSLDLEFTVSPLLELKKWLLSWGSQASVPEARFCRGALFALLFGQTASEVGEKEQVLMVTKSQ